MAFRKKVLVAMSGGIDSSVAAYLLKKKGFSVIGATMKLWPSELCGNQNRLRACCSLKAVEDARDVASKLGIPYYVFDFHKEFKDEVIDYFCSEYAKGRTPNPCIMCNNRIKFDRFLEKAEALGCAYIATGHYAKIGYKKGTKRYFVKEGKDKKKDQSYFLFYISQKALSKTLFPLGGLTKPESRRIAENLKLRIHDKKSSQEVCFIEGHYADYVKEWSGGNFEEGDILNVGGAKIARHKGIHFYTIGQRRGLGVPYAERLYVVHIDRRSNSITVGSKGDVMKKTVIVKDGSWGPVKDIYKTEQVSVKIRYGQKKAKAAVRKINSGKLRLDFRRPQLAPTPGQAAVFYKKDIVLGGGWIDAVE